MYNMGCSDAVESNIAAYNYVVSNYNIAPDVFVMGRSMGGMTSMNLVCKDEIPVLAHIQEAPVLSYYRQLYCYPWSTDNIKLTASLYKFDFSKYNTLHGTSYTKTSFPYSLKEKTVSDAERELFRLNFADCIAPMVNIYKYCPQFFDYDTKTFKAGYEDFLSTTDETRITEIYDSISINYLVPVRIYHGKYESVVPYIYSERFAAAVNKGTSSGATLLGYESANHCALGNDVEVYCKDGSVMTTKSSFVDMFNYFRTFE